jgi:hypothetical protein
MRRAEFEAPYAALPGGLILRSRSISAAHPVKDGRALRVYVEGVPVPFDLEGADAAALHRYLDRRADHPHLEPAAARCSQEPEPAEAAVDWDDTITLGPAAEPVSRLDGDGDGVQDTVWGRVEREREPA